MENYADGYLINTRKIHPAIPERKIIRPKSMYYSKELNSLPSLNSSDSEEESNTITSQEIKDILEKNEIINTQVKLRMKKLADKSQFYSKNTNDKIRAAQKSMPAAAVNNSIVIDKNQFNSLKNQQEYLLGLIDQVKTLQEEINSSTRFQFKKSINDSNDDKTDATKCIVEGMSENKKNTCTCEIH